MHAFGQWEVRTHVSKGGTCTSFNFKYNSTKNFFKELHIKYMTMAFTVSFLSSSFFMMLLSLLFQYWKCFTNIITLSVMSILNMQSHHCREQTHALQAVVCFCCLLTYFAGLLGVSQSITTVSAHSQYLLCYPAHIVMSFCLTAWLVLPFLVTKGPLSVIWAQLNIPQAGWEWGLGLEGL